MRALVASRLRGPVASRISPDDVVQSVFRAFVEHGVGRGGHVAPDGRELWGLLCTLAMNKLRERVAYHQAARRDVRRTAGGVETLAEPAAEAAWLEVEVDDLLGRLRPADREVVRLRMAGYEVTEIADLTARSQRTVERVLQSARTKSDRPTGLTAAQDAMTHTQAVPVAATGEPDESVIAAFEQALRAGGAPAVADFAPPAPATHRLATLIELVRSDLEWQWSHGTPKSAAAYLAEHPELADADAALRGRGVRGVPGRGCGRRAGPAGRLPGPLPGPDRFVAGSGRPPTSAAAGGATVRQAIAPVAEPRRRARRSAPGERRPAGRRRRCPRSGPSSSASGSSRSWAAGRSAGSTWPARATWPTGRWR